MLLRLLKWVWRDWPCCVEIVAQPSHTIAGEDAEEPLVDLVKVDGRCSAELSEFWVGAKNVDASEGEMC
jgi:hypothetical protein